MNQLIYNEQKAAELINLNCRQRMLSQKMALYSLELIQETDGNKRIWLRKQLSDATKSMENAQTRLNGEEFSGFVQASLEDKEKIDTYIKNGNEVVVLSEPAFSDEMKKKVREMIEKSNEVLLIEGVRENWTPIPVKIINYEFDFLNSLNLQNPILANAFIIKDIPYFWKKGKRELWSN